nr:glycoside hydrolase family 30 protein [Candidatus Sigynarchaeota archaeon]
MPTIETYLSTRFQGRCLAKLDPVAFSREKPAGRFTLDVHVDETIKYQDILGMGYSFEPTSCCNLLLLPETDRRKVMELLVHPTKGADMNLWRLCIGSPDFTPEFYSYDDMPAGKTDPLLKHFSIEKDKQHVIPVAKLAREINPDVLFFASPWSPPGWMKIPESTFRKGKAEVEGGKGMCSGKLNPQYYSVYADYLIKYLQAYHDEGIPIHALTVQNEPHQNWYLMPSCWWDAENERDFIKIHLGPKLEKSGLKTKIWCFDHNFGFFKPTPYPGIILKDPAAAKYVDGIALHGYESLPRYMGVIKKRFPEKSLYFTEGSIFWLMGAARIITFFKYGSNSYNGWVPFIATDGSPNIGPFPTRRTILQRIVPGADLEIREAIPESCAFPIPGVLARFDFYILSHFTKFIQRGAFRIASTTRTPFLVSEVSFLNPDGSIITVIVNRRHKPIRARLTWKELHAAIALPRQSIATLRWQPK